MVRVRSTDLSHLPTAAALELAIGAEPKVLGDDGPQGNVLARGAMRIWVAPCGTGSTLLALARLVAGAVFVRNVLRRERQLDELLARGGLDLPRLPLHQSTARLLARPGRRPQAHLATGSNRAGSARGVLIGVAL